MLKWETQIFGTLLLSGGGRIWLAQLMSQSKWASQSKCLMHRISQCNMFNYISKWSLTKSLSPHEFLQNANTMIVDFSAFHSALYVISSHTSTYFLRGLFRPSVGIHKMYWMINLEMNITFRKCSYSAIGQPQIWMYFRIWANILFNDRQ